MATRALGLVAVTAALAGQAGCDKKRAEPEAQPAAPPAARDRLAAVRWDAAPPDWSRPVPVTPAGGLAEAGYAGSAACRPCHTEIHDRYARHPMARSGMRPLAALDQKWLATIFDAGAGSPVPHPRSGYAYRPFRRGQKYYVEEILNDAQGKPVQSWEQPITHALSAGDYGLSLYFAQGSRLWHVPIDYFAKAGRWGLDPFATGGNPRFFSPLGPFCISCHSDYPRRRAGAHGSFELPMPAGIGCERCHGPGQRHVETMAIEDVVDPARLPALRQLELCTQCHLESGSIARAGRHEFSYRPGEPLSAYRVNFLAEPAEIDRVGLLAHSERLVRSACWRGSGRVLTCTTCHDPHGRSAEQPKDWWDGRCRACHEERPCTEAPAARAAAGDHCVGCHMQTAPAAGIEEITVTDHWIQRRPPPIRPGPRATPERLVTWAAFVGEPLAGDDLAAVEAAGHHRAGLNERALELAGGAVARRPQVAELYALMAGHLRRTGQVAEAGRAHAQVLRFDPDDRAALLGYAMAVLDAGAAGAADEAGRAFDRLLALDPQDSRALELYGMLRFRGGQVDQARTLFERAVAAGPGAGSARVGLAALALRAGRRAEAIAQLEVARRIEPTDVWILDQLEAAYRADGAGPRAAEIDDLRARLAAMGKRPAITSVSGWLPPDWR